MGAATDRIIAHKITQNREIQRTVVILGVCVLWIPDLRITGV